VLRLTSTLFPLQDFWPARFRCVGATEGLLGDHGNRRYFGCGTVEMVVNRDDAWYATKLDSDQDCLVHLRAHDTTQRATPSATSQDEAQQRDCCHSDVRRWKYRQWLSEKTRCDRCATSFEPTGASSVPGTSNGRRMRGISTSIVTLSVIRAASYSIVYKESLELTYWVQSSGLEVNGGRKNHSYSNMHHRMWKCCPSSTPGYDLRNR
jgi:hypothetical protein